MIKKLSKGRVRHTLSLGSKRIPARHVAEHESSRVLLSVGQAVFEFEDISKSSRHNILEIVLAPGLISRAKAKKISQTLEQLIEFVLMKKVDVRFNEDKDPFQLDAIETLPASDVVALFSGGVDSLSGTMIAADRFSHVDAVFCAHLHQGRVISLTRALADKYLKRRGVTLTEIPSPSMSTSGYSQTRGFLYVLSGAAVASSQSISKVVVSECGPTMYQPKFGPADQVTMTTHPYVMEKAQQVIDIVSPGLRISTPFENLTKAEVMAVSPDPSAFRRSHSCISQRLVEHDGTCFGCVVRRLSAIASKTPDVRYAKNPIANRNAKSGNLLTLLSFCSDFLTCREDMPAHQLELIESYGKIDLFERFGLDNFAALHLLRRQNKRLTPAVAQLFEHTVKKLGGVRILNHRVRELSAMRKNPPILPF